MIASPSTSVLRVGMKAMHSSHWTLTRQFSCSYVCRTGLRQNSSNSASRRSARFAARPGANMVGPPDRLSNLRPIRYGSAFEEEYTSATAAQNSDSSTSALTHPYSLNEFTASTSGSSTLSRARKGRSHSVYFEQLLAKLEEAELSQKLRSARTDSFNQHFWQDNNARFIQALSGFRSRTGSSKAVATLRTSATTSDASSSQTKKDFPINTNQQESELDLDSDSLATFYSAWLKANAARHRAYNRQLWSQTFGDLAPAARYQCLRAWAKFVGSIERRLGRG